MYALKILPNYVSNNYYYYFINGKALLLSEE